MSFLHTASVFSTCALSLESMYVQHCLQYIITVFLLEPRRSTPSCGQLSNAYCGVAVVLTFVECPQSRHVDMFTNALDPNLVKSLHAPSHGLSFLTGLSVLLVRAAGGGTRLFRFVQSKYSATNLGTAYLPANSAVKSSAYWGSSARICVYILPLCFP